MAGPGRLGATGGFLSGLPDRLPPEAGRGSGARLAVGHASQRRPRISQNHNLSNRRRSPRSGCRSGRPPLSVTFSEEERKGFEARKYFLKGGGPGAIALAAGAGILKTTDTPEGAQRFIEYLLSETAQAYFSTTTKEYPLVDGASVDLGLPPPRFSNPLSNRGTWTWAT